MHVSVCHMLYRKLLQQQQQQQRSNKSTHHRSCWRSLWLKKERESAKHTPTPTAIVFPKRQFKWNEGEKTSYNQTATTTITTNTRQVNRCKLREHNTALGHIVNSSTVLVVHMEKLWMLTVTVCWVCVRAIVWACACICWCVCVCSSESE